MMLLTCCVVVGFSTLGGIEVVDSMAEVDVGEKIVAVMVPAVSGTAPEISKQMVYTSTFAWSLPVQLETIHCTAPSPIVRPDEFSRVHRKVRSDVSWHEAFS